MCASGAGGASVPGVGRETCERVAGPPGTRFAVVRRFAELDSTNRYLLDEARAGAPDGTVAVAAHQSAGRGRLDRRWEAPAGANVLLSVLVRRDLAPDELYLCTAAVALAAVAACERVAGLVPELKWPNDLVVGDRKLAGILAESVPGAGQEIAVVVGIGLNVRWPPPETLAEPPPEQLLEPSPEQAPEPSPEPPPEQLLEPSPEQRSGARAPAEVGDGVSGAGGTGADDLLRTATSLWRETGLACEPADVVGALLTELEPRLADLASRPSRLRMAGDYRRRCTTVGRVVRVSLPDEHLTGTAVDITPEGHLVVDLGACVRTVTAGDVVHVRAQG